MEDETLVLMEVLLRCQQQTTEGSEKELASKMTGEESVILFIKAFGFFSPDPANVSSMKSKTHYHFYLFTVAEF